MLAKTASSSRLRIKLPESSSRPLPAKRPNMQLSPFCLEILVLLSQWSSDCGHCLNGAVSTFNGGMGSSVTPWVAVPPGIALCHHRSLCHNG